MLYIGVENKIRAQNKTDNHCRGNTPVHAFSQFQLTVEPTPCFPHFLQ